MNFDMSINCWDYEKCPQNRKNTCQAFKSNSGKKCWLVTGTMCGGLKQKDMKEKIAKCRHCEFYEMRRGVAG